MVDHVRHCGADPEPVDLVAARLAAAYEGLPEQTRAAPESGSLPGVEVGGG